MNRFANFFSVNLRYGWWFVATFSALAALTVGWTDLFLHEQQHQAQLETEAQRSALEIMSNTVNGNLMGSITLLGLMDGDIKQEATNGLLPSDAHIEVTLSTLGNAFGAEGVFVVGQDGIVKTSWDRSSKPSTGLDVRFRPYYHMAMRGQTSVYAAVSMARGDRSLYFSAPVYAERARASSGVGAVVARTALDRVDALLKKRFDIALLLSPQGVVFASSRENWAGMMDGNAGPERLQAIRELKQFGAMFEKNVPQTLPVSTQPGRHTLEGRQYAVASSAVDWNDPYGPWKLVVMEDLDRAVPLTSALQSTLTAALISMLLGWMWLHLLRGHRAQAETTVQLKHYAAQQEAAVQYRAELASALVRLQRASTLEGIAQDFLAIARDLLGTQQGLVYVADPDQAELLLLAGSAACAHAPPPILLAGEGLLGQCLVERQRKVYTAQHDGAWQIHSGLGSAAPQALLMAPLMIQQQIIGAVELATLVPPDAQTLEKFDDLSLALSNALEILRRHLQLLQHAQGRAGAERENP